jgi:predicted lipid-binding transport protein (Tim44 family)
MVLIDVSLSSLFFFMLGFLAAISMVILLAILWVIFPKIGEAKRFFDFWLKIKDKNKGQP